MKRIRALMVEDSEDDAVLLVRLLERANYEVASARVCNAEDLQAALDRGSWDVVFADYTMPHFNSLAALKIVKERLPDVPFIIVSGTIGEDMAVAAMKGGAQDYLIKGNLARLVPALDRELREAEVRRERRRAQDALMAAEARFRTLVEEALVGIYVLRPDGTFAYVNPRLAEIFGYTPEQIMAGMSTHDLGAEEDR